MSNRPTPLTDALHDYVLAHGFREHPELAALRAATAGHEWAVMQITPEQGAFMQVLVELLGVRRYLEFGVFTGYSALAVALAMPADGRVTALDIDADYVRIGQPHWQRAGVTGKIELRLGDARETARQLLAEGRADTYDFAFIDADKAGYDAYYEASLKLVRPGGLIGVDNAFHLGRIGDPSRADPSTPIVDALNRKIKADERVTMAMLPAFDGLTLCRKR